MPPLHHIESTSSNESNLFVRNLFGWVSIRLFRSSVDDGQTCDTLELAERWKETTSSVGANRWFGLLHSRQRQHTQDAIWVDPIYAITLSHTFSVVESGNVCTHALPSNQLNFWLWSLTLWWITNTLEAKKKKQPSIMTDSMTMTHAAIFLLSTEEKCAHFPTTKNLFTMNEYGMCS